MALNRFYRPTKFKSRNEFMIQKVKCVFISYQNKDKSDAKKVADYLINAGIDVYFDEYDENLKFTNQEKHPGNVTDSLCVGINNSSHMLVIVSPTTLVSKWVPFEIGFGYDKTDLAVLCLKGIPKGGLPEYIRTAKVIRDIYDLNVRISSIKGVVKQTLMEKKMLFSHNAIENPLYRVMDKSIVMKY